MLIFKCVGKIVSRAYANVIHASSTLLVVCPPVDPISPGLCTELCSSDIYCDDGERCCYTLLVGRLSRWDVAISNSQLPFEQNFPLE